MPSAADDDCGFAVDATNEKIDDVTLSCGGADVTVNVTSIDCDLPAHGPEVHVTTTVPE